MKLLSLLRKEVFWSRHRIALLCFLLVFLPGLLAFSTGLFQTALPEDTPIAVVAANDDVTADELTVVEGGATLVSDPRRYDSKAAAMDALDRESVYGVLEVPPGLLDERTGNATLRLYIHGGVVPFVEPSGVIVDVLGPYLDQELPANVSIERVTVGTQPTLSAYLMPVFLLGFVVMFAFTYLPYNLEQESDVLERLQVESSLDAVVLSKLVYMTLLMVVPIGVFGAVSRYLGHGVQFLSPGVVGIVLLTFLYLSAISASIMILTGFSTLGRFCNVVVMAGLVTVSGIAYPVGFYSPVRREIARLMPLHYSTLITRGLALKELPLGLFTDWLLALLAVTLGTGVVLKLAIEHYKRTSYR